MFVSRSSLENPRPLERLVRTSSPSNISTFSLCAASSEANAVAKVVLPAPESPVNQTVNPLCLVIDLSLYICDEIDLSATTTQSRLPVRLPGLDRLLSAPARLPAGRTRPGVIHPRPVTPGLACRRASHAHGFRAGRSCLKPCRRTPGNRKCDRKRAV